MFDGALYACSYICAANLRLCLRWVCLTTILFIWKLEACGWSACYIHYYWRHSFWQSCYVMLLCTLRCVVSIYCDFSLIFHETHQGENFRGVVTVNQLSFSFRILTTVYKTICCEGFVKVTALWCRYTNPNLTHVLFAFSAFRV